MAYSVLDGVNDIVTDPYPYLVVHDALPESYYEELYRTMPVPSTQGMGQNERRDVRSLAVLQGDYSKLWQDFVAYHTSAEFFGELWSIFHDSIMKYYPDLNPDMSCGPRGTGADLQMEAQAGIDTPVTEWSTVRGPHLDNPVELYGGLLYMRDPDDYSEGGHLEVQRYTRDPEWFGKLELKRSCVETVAVVPYRANTLVIFLNTPDSIHAVTPREPTEHLRKHVNIIGEVKQPLFHVGHGRY